MSLAALLVAVRDELRGVLAMPDAVIGIEEDGQPPPGIGASTYIAIHPVSWRPSNGREVVMGLDESYAIGVTITKRVGYIPQDRMVEEMYLKSLVGFEQLARRIMVAIHQSGTVMERANQFILANKLTDTQTDPFIEWLRWRSTQEVPTKRDGSWMWETNPDKIDNLAFETITIVFSEARRIQKSSLME
jgi:hypothetical protein